MMDLVIFCFFFLNLTLWTFSPIGNTFIAVFGVFCHLPEVVLTVYTKSWNSISTAGLFTLWVIVFSLISVGIRAMGRLYRGFSSIFSESGVTGSGSSSISSIFGPFSITTLENCTMLWRLGSLAGWMTGCMVVLTSADISSNCSILLAVLVCGDTTDIYFAFKVDSNWFFFHSTI